jgi:hypothetical protein
MKVRFIQSPSGSPHSLGYFQGDVAELNEMTAKELIKAGIAESLTDKPIVSENNPVIETKISEKPKKAIKR